MPPRPARPERSFISEGRASARPTFLQRISVSTSGTCRSMSLRANLSERETLFLARRDYVFRASTVDGHPVVLAGGVTHEFNSAAGEILDSEISPAHWDQLADGSRGCHVLEHVIFAHHNRDRQTAVIVLAGQRFEKFSVAHLGRRLARKDNRLDVGLERNGNAGQVAAEVAVKLHPRQFQRVLPIGGALEN